MNGAPGVLAITYVLVGAIEASTVSDLDILPSTTVSGLGGGSGSVGLTSMGGERLKLTGDGSNSIQLQGGNRDSCQC
jgi:hypothetical protein